MTILQIKQLVKIYGKKVLAVQGIDLEVQDGEFLVLLGPSGCGKTTTLRMIAGLEEVTDGEIILDNIDITDLPPRKRRVSMVFQNYAVWPHMTVFENIAYALKLRKMPKEEIKTIVERVAAMSKIDMYLERYPSQLSGGQQQRVAVARAIAVSPKLFLMDEPLSNLDAKLRSTMRTELKAIHNAAKATSIFVTHDQSEAMSMADRIVIMKDGIIMQIGTPDEVYHNCKNLFVADFIGTPPTNFFTVSISKEKEELHAKNSHLDITLNPANRIIAEPYTGKNVILGVRPENMFICEAKEADLTINCLVSEPQGSHQIVSAMLDETMIKFLAPPHPIIDSGETIHLRIVQDAMFLFDCGTEERIR